MDPVKASPALPLDPAEFIRRFEVAARAAGFRLERFGAIQGHPLIAATKRTPGPRPRVYLSTGIHGDEPAPPWALLGLLESGFFDSRCQWFLCPLLNPLGFVGRCRGNEAGVDLNRDYKSPQAAETRAHISWLQRQPLFDLVICVHEDWEATGFYLYELNLGSQSSLASAMIDAARKVVPIEPATVIDGRAVDEPGVIRPVSDPLLRETWPEAIYLRNFHATSLYTIETPSVLPLADRVATHTAVLRAAIDGLLR